MHPLHKRPRRPLNLVLRHGRKAQPNPRPPLPVPHRLAAGEVRPAADGHEVRRVRQERRQRAPEQRAAHRRKERVRFQGDADPHEHAAGGPAEGKEQGRGGSVGEGPALGVWGGEVRAGVEDPTHGGHAALVDGVEACEPGYEARGAPGGGGRGRGRGARGEEGEGETAGCWGRGGRGGRGEEELGDEGLGEAVGLLGRGRGYSTAGGEGGAVSEGEEGLGRGGVLLLDDGGLGGDPAYTAAGDEDLGEGV